MCLVMGPAQKTGIKRISPVLHPITYNSELCVIEIKYQGEIRMNELRGIFSDVLPYVKEHDCFWF